MLAFYQTTPLISSDFFAGSPWETKRSDDLSEARSLLLQPKAVQCFPSFLEDDGGVLLVSKLSLIFRKTREKMTNLANLSVRSDTSQCEPRYRVCAVTIPIWRRARALEFLEFGPTNYESVYT